VVRRFARNLQRTREASGLTRSALAAKAKISVPYVTMLELGKREPSIVTVVKLARALKVGVEELVR